MRTTACLMMLVGCTLAARLDNTYLPPSGAAQAGGSNLATPFQSSFLAPGSSGSAIRAGSSGASFNSGSSGFNAGSSSFNSGSGSFSSQSASSASRFGAQQQQAQPAQVNSYSSSSSNYQAQPAQVNSYSSSSNYQAQPAQVNSYSSSSSSFQANKPRAALIIKQVNENPGDGTYTFSYETENGIQAEERGQIRADGAEGLAAVQGAYAFTAPDNNVRYTVTYTADENGFLAYGDHLPTPPPVPAEIQRALEQNAADEARGLLDDGQYRAEHHGEQLQQRQQQQQGAFLRGGSSSSTVSNSGNFNSGSGSSSSGSSGYSSNGGYRY